MSATLTIGLAQLTGSVDRPQDNRRRTMEWAHRAYAEGAELVVLPELIVSGYAVDPRSLHEAAEPLDGPSVQGWLELADQHGGYLAGGLCERDGDRLYNTAVLVGDGQVLLHYRKLHLFAGEKRAFAPGDLGLPIARTRRGVFGLCVCYDLRFVETLRILALAGAEVVCVPTAWVSGFDRADEDRDAMPPQAHGALLQANLDQVFVACASQVGVPGAFELLGGSLIGDPYGRCVCGPLSGAHEELALATIDLSAVRAAQARGDGISPRGDRRTDVYRLVVGERAL